MGNIGSLKIQPDNEVLRYPEGGSSNFCSQNQCKDNNNY